MNNKVIKTIGRLKNKLARFELLDSYGFYRYLSDEKYLKKYYKLREGKELNLDTPLALNEKLQWLKLYDRKPVYKEMADKYTAKKYVANIIGEEHIIPTLGIWENFDLIDFSALPDSFILKCTHDSGDVFICRDKEEINKKVLKRKLNRRLGRNYYERYGREWVYKDIPPRIIAEKLLVNKDGSPVADYKFYCYGGKPVYFMYSLGEAEHNVRNHKFDMEQNSIDYLFKRKAAIEEDKIHLPSNIQDMIIIVEKLCRGFPHIRVDLYNVDGKIYFGELTFYTSSGFIHMDSKEYSDYLAGLIDINTLKAGMGKKYDHISGT